jgi:hypothetical protein
LKGENPSLQAVSKHLTTLPDRSSFNRNRSKKAKAKQNRSNKMQSSNDIMMQMMLSQLSSQLMDLQKRVTNQEETINSLKNEIALLRRPMAPPLPFTPPQQSLPSVATTPATMTAQTVKRTRPKVAMASQSDEGQTQQKEQKEQKEKGAFPLSTILHENEEVTVNIGTIWDAKAKTHVQFTTLTTVFDGKELVVTAAQDKAAESLIGMKSEKPGNILYKFRDALLAAGVIKKEFTIAPWKLCTVSRGGKSYNLEEIRENPICG